MNKNIKLILLSILVLIIISIFIYFQVVIPSIEDSRKSIISDSLEVKSNIEKHVSNNDKFSFSDINHYKWDAVYFFGPYSNVRSELRDLDVKDRFLIPYAIQSTEQFILFVMIKDKQVVNYVQFHENFIGHNLKFNDTQNILHTKFNLVTGFYGNKTFELNK